MCAVLHIILALHTLYTTQCGGAISNLFKTTTTGIYAKTGFNSSRRKEAISQVNCCISLGNKQMPYILMLEIEEYLIKVWAGKLFEV